MSAKNTKPGSMVSSLESALAKAAAERYALDQQMMHTTANWLCELERDMRAEVRAEMREHADAERAYWTVREARQTAVLIRQTEQMRSFRLGLVNMTRPCCTGKEVRSR